MERNHVLNVQNCETVYLVPLLLRKQKLDSFLVEIFQIQDKVKSEKYRKDFMQSWTNFTKYATYTHGNKDVKIAMIGKYVKLSDAYLSVTKALKHAAIYCGVNLEILTIEAEDLEDVADNEENHKKSINYHNAWSHFYQADGILVPGGFGHRGIPGKLLACKHAREHNIPLLGICLGMQSIVIEYCRNVLGLKDANSTEFDEKTTNPCVIDMPEHNQGELGGTMRLGLRKSIFVESTDVASDQESDSGFKVGPSGDNSLTPDKNSSSSKLRQLYARCNHTTYTDQKSFNERHRHRYEVNPDFIPKVEAKNDLIFTAKDETKTRMEAVELKSHPYYVGLQAHPEFLSRPLDPSPPYLGLILASLGKENLSKFLSTGKTDSDDDGDDCGLEDLLRGSRISSGRHVSSNSKGSE